MGGRNWKHRRRNRIYRRIAVALTVALLAGQSHAFVLAEEKVDMPQTGISAEENGTDAADGGNTDGDNTENGGSGIEQDDEKKDDVDSTDIEDVKSPEDDKNSGDSEDSGDDGNTEEYQGGEDQSEQCGCGTKCVADAVNTECSVCMADYNACIGNADDTENDTPEGDGEENIDGLADEQDKCVCETTCVEGAVNANCPVCAVDYTVCIGKKVVEVGKVIFHNSIKYVVTGDCEIEVVGPGLGVVIRGDITIPESLEQNKVTYRVTSVGEKAFYECDKLTSVRLPESVKSIGGYAFYKCGRLTSVTIPESVESINDSVFYECSSLTDVTIPESVESISDSAFYKCSSLTSITIPESVESIGEFAFAGCSRLSSVEILKGVTNIGDHAFAVCSSLTDITIPEGVTSIGEQAFFHCANLRSIEIPKSVINIGAHAFDYCINLISVEIPEGVASIEEGVFSECAGLTSVTIPKSVTSVGRAAFWSCQSLTSIEIPENVTNINWWNAFADCSSLISLKIPNGITSVGEQGCWNCLSLTSVTISENITNIGRFAFTDCEKLEELQIVILADGNFQFPNVEKRAFDGLPNTRKIIFVDNNGKKLTRGNVYNNAKASFEVAATSDNDGNNNTWCGWALEEPSETVDTHKITINAKKDNQLWSESDHNRSFALTKDNGIIFVADLDAVEAGTYTIYDVTGVTADEFQTKGVNTGVTVTVTDGSAEAEINYYTATFYDGKIPYGADTLQQPQILLSGQQAVKPDDPSKAGWQFAGWKTEDKGNIEYHFGDAVTKATSIYASWIENTEEKEQFSIVASATDGGEIFPKGEVSVTKGGERTFTITPDEGYRIKGVAVDGSDATDDLKDTLARAQAGARYYTFRNVAASHTIDAEFESDEGIPGGGGDNPNPGGGDDGDNPNPGGGGDNPNPGGGDDGDNPNPGGGDDGDNPNPGGGGDNANPGGGGNGGGNHSGGSNGAGDHSDSNGSGGTENTQVTVVSELPSAPAGNDAAGNIESAQISGGQESRTGDVEVSGIRTVAEGTVAGTSGQASNGKEPKTGDTTHMEVYATIAMVAGLTYLLLYFMEEGRGMTEREKDVFVAAFIRWGKKGGAFRKGCAMIAIFCLLAYYHAIGKRAGRNILNEKYLGQTT